MKGHQGTGIKDRWAKPKGVGLKVRGDDGWGRRVEVGEGVGLGCGGVEGWGDNAENSN